LAVLITAPLIGQRPGGGTRHRWEWCRGRGPRGGCLAHSGAHDDGRRTTAATTVRYLWPPTPGAGPGIGVGGRRPGPVGPSVGRPLTGVGVVAEARLGTDVARRPASSGARPFPRRLPASTTTAGPRATGPDAALRRVGYHLVIC
jgi:hypothetical protein